VHPVSSRSWGAALAIATSLTAPLRAQHAPRVGELVEARIVGPADPLLGHFCRAWLGAVAGDTLVLNRSESCARGSHVARVRVHTGDRGSRWTHAAIGLVAGAVVGGLAGRTAAGDGCSPPGGCDDGGYVVGILTFVGSATGALSGVAVGAAMPTGRRWVELEGERPIKVGAFDLRPAMRVSLDERRR